MTGSILQCSESFNIFQDEHLWLLHLDVVDAVTHDGTSALWILKAVPVPCNGERLTRETGNIKIHIWCFGIVTLCDIFIELLGLEVVPYELC